MTTIVVAGCCVLAMSSPVSAGPTYGIYDARTLAMGGASVSSANNDNAQFYNPALLAFNEEIEERTRDSRFLFPLLVPQAANSFLDIEQLTHDDAAGSITRAVGEFNTLPNDMTARAVVDASANMDSRLADIEGEDLFADVFFGLAVSEPGKFQGAGVFIGTRVIAGGQTSVTAADRALLSAYQEGLEFVATNGAQGLEHPELFDANGALIDPGDDFDSTASAAGAVITEAGVAMSRQLQLFGQPLAAGLSFKVQKINTFEDVERLVDDRIDTDQFSDLYHNVNFDIGVVRELNERWRVALAVKDVIPHNYRTTLGTVLRFRPRARLGASYQAGHLQIGADADLTRSEPLGGERPTQEVAIGAEWSLWSPVRLRAGYRHDIQDNRDGILSFGVGTVWRELAFDMALAAGNDTKAAAFQVGIVF